MSNAGVVDENVESAKFSTYYSEELGDTRLVADVARMRKTLNSLALELLLNALKLARIAAADDEMASLDRQCARDRETNPLRGAGDEGDFAF